MNKLNIARKEYSLIDHLSFHLFFLELHHTLEHRRLLASSVLPISPLFHFSALPSNCTKVFAHQHGHNGALGLTIYAEASSY